MSKIKITCNPYTKENQFQVYNDSTNDWDSINEENNPNSKLVSEKFQSGFFPFIISDAIKEIVREYGVEDEESQVIFEGTKEDYNELESVCKDIYSDYNITLMHGSHYLYSAADLLEDIKSVFKDLRPIIVDTKNNKDEVTKNIDNFIEVTNDVVPLCIMGNYSAGKSTFINALIGHEILPSGDEPVTAKMFKIIQSHTLNIASIEFKRAAKVSIILNDELDEVICDDSDDSLVLKIIDEINEIQEESIPTRVNKVLSIINQFDCENTSDLIEVTIPFNGIWNQVDAKFVILDTPGSNSATNKDHLEVLETALAGLTNGMSIYISEYDTLDSMDNMKLHEIIKNLKEIDERFTLIVVNKADENDLPEEGIYSPEKEDQLLNLAVPKNLYNEGIFFVSSILGLGSKTDGKFSSKHLKRIYRKSKLFFDDEDDEDYTVLYNYNIMPKQLKEKSIKTIQSSNEDLVYQNSGLHSVELEVQNFAQNYAMYNKCKQSTTYLDKAIECISIDIHEAIATRAEIKEALEAALEKEKADLITKVKFASNMDRDKYVINYEIKMKDNPFDSKPSFEYEEIKSLEKDIFEAQKDSLSFDIKDEQAKNSMGSLKENFKVGVDEVIKNKNINSVKSLGKNLVGDAKDTFDDFEQRKSLLKEINRSTSKLLLTRLNKEFNIQSTSSKEVVDTASKEYWHERSMDIKNELSRIITGSEALSDAKRSELADIIMTFQDIEFTQFEDVSFTLENYLQGVRLGDFVIFEADRLNIKKVVGNYNDLFEKYVQEVSKIVSKKHIHVFDTWIDQLLSTIQNNIVNYSPELSQKQKDIEEATQVIYDLEDKKEKIKVGKKKINHIMNWQVK